MQLGLTFHRVDQLIDNVPHVFHGIGCVIVVLLKCPKGKKIILHDIYGTCNTVLCCIHYQEVKHTVSQNVKRNAHMAVVI